MNNKKNIENIKKLVLISILTAVAIVIGIFEIPMPFAPWLKLDFSELVILISNSLLGYIPTIIVIILRSLIRFLISPGSTNIPIPFFGELIAITTSLLIISSYKLISIILKYNDIEKINFKTPKTYLILITKILLTTLISSIIITILNILFITPSYMLGELTFITNNNILNITNSLKIDNNTSSYIIFIIVIYLPFNIIKVSINCIIYTILIKPISHIMKK